MMKKLLLLVFAAAVVSGAHAYDYPFLTFRAADGSLRSVSVESLTLTVSDGSLVVRNADGETSFQLTDLDAMFFTSETTGITLASSSGQPGEVDVVSVTGVSVGKFASAEAAKAALPGGVYIINENGETRKMIIR